VLLSSATEVSTSALLVLPSSDPITVVEPDSSGASVVASTAVPVSLPQHVGRTPMQAAIKRDRNIVSV